MFKLFEKLKNFFNTPTLKETFEDLILQEAVKEATLVKEVVNSQITDAVTQIAPEKPKRAPRKNNGEPKKPRTKKK